VSLCAERVNKPLLKALQFSDDWNNLSYTGAWRLDEAKRNLVAMDFWHLFNSLGCCNGSQTNQIAISLAEHWFSCTIGSCRGEWFYFGPN